MPEEMDLIKAGTIRRYVKEVLDMRISTTSVDTVRIRFNSIVKKVLREAKKASRKDDRSTLMPRDVDPQIEAQLGKKNLSSVEIVKQIKRLNAIELGELVKTVNKHVQDEKEKKSL